MTVRRIPSRLSFVIPSRLSFVIPSRRRGISAARNAEIAARNRRQCRDDGTGDRNGEIATRG
jgi:hypothetical protein